MKKFWKPYFLDILLIPIGSGLTALGTAVFNVPNRIAPGGVSGLATALAYVLHFPVGMLTLFFNIPLLIIAWRKLGLPSLAKTIAATVVLAVATDILIATIPPYTNNTLLAALMGGALTGVGLGLLLMRGISTGGTDLISLMLVQSRPSFSMGQFLLLIDTLVVAIAVIIFRDVEVALYSMVTLFVCSKCIDVMQQGMNYAKVIYIITENAEALLERFAHGMGRGVTILPARGGFTGREKNMLMLIARRSEVSITLQIIRQLDPDAFTILADATEVHGKGFKE